MTILPIAYLPSVAYFAHLVRGGCVVDLGEHFIKRSERNRARILAPDGVMELTVHVRNANRPRTPVRDVRIDYSKRWQHVHWGALVASYKASPYFDFYCDRFEPFYRGRYEFLADYDLALLECLADLLGVAVPSVSERYVDAGPDDTDLRPKRREASFAGGAESGREAAACGCDASGSAPGTPIMLPQPQKKGPAFRAEPYVQVFSDRLPFAPNLSVADLLFAEGPAAVSVLKRCLPAG